MSKTTFDPKICTIPPQNGGSGGISGISGAKTGDSVDIYRHAGIDPYRNLISGAKAQTTPISEMLTEIDNIAVQSREDPMQAFLGNFVMGTSGASSEDFDANLPVVPLFRKLLKKIPNVRPEAVVHKYRALLKTLRVLKNNAEMTLKHPSLGARMSTDEIRSLMDHSKKLDQLLIKCRKQLDYAEAYRKRRDDDLRGNVIEVHERPAGNDSNS